MKINCFLFSWFICIYSYSSSSAQSAKSTLRSWVISPKLSTNGWEIGMQLKNKSDARFGISVGEIKHEKEMKQHALSEFDSYKLKHKNFNLGKINHAYTLKIGTRLWYHDPFKFKINNQKIRFESNVGLQLMILKPIYLHLRYFHMVDTIQYTSLQSEKYTANNHDIFTDRFSVAGSDKWIKGLRDIKLNPGFWINAQIKLQTVDMKYFAIIIGLGSAVDIFLYNYDIMVGFRERRVMLNGFVFAEIQLKKYNKK